MSRRPPVKVIHSEYRMQNQHYPIAVHYCYRKTWSLSINKKGCISLRIPHKTSKKDWTQFLKLRESWILNQINHWVNIHPNPICYQNGEPVPILGKNTSLVLEYSEERTKISWLPNSLIIKTKDESEKEIQKVLQNWVRKMAIPFLLERIRKITSEVPSVSSGYIVEYRFRRMKRRWGSCSSKGIITLNTDLFKAPIKAIDYVIIHELCHLKVFHHGPLFKEMLQSFCPDWKARKKLLLDIPDW